MMINNNKKIILFYTSGLGNALFQIAGVLDISERMEIKNLNVSELLTKKNILTTIRGWTIHNNLIVNRIKSLNIKTKKDNITSYIAIFTLFVKFVISDLCTSTSFERLFKLFTNKYIKHFRSFMKINLFGNIYIYGYFQDKLYLNREKGRQLTFKLVEGIGDLEKINKSNLAIHIRQGDFQIKSLNLNLRYYEKAIENISENTNKKFNNIIFTGVYDKKYSKKLSEIIKDKLDYNKIIDEKSSQIEDFKKLWESEYIISSNSTFSLWPSIYGNSKYLYIPKFYQRFSNLIYKKVTTI